MTSVTLVQCSERPQFLDIVADHLDSMIDKFLKKRQRTRMGDSAFILHYIFRSWCFSFGLHNEVAKV